MNTAFRNFYKICSMTVVLALVAGIAVIPVQAAANGIYLAQAQTHYANPVTGQIEDSGGTDSYALGQSMTQNVVYSQALVEVDPEGNTYVTVRLQMMDNIENPRFQTAGGSGAFSAVSAQLMQEDSAVHTADYRMNIPDENAIIRCSLYVTPMGRDVIFFITLSGLTAGSGDFVTSVAITAPASDAVAVQPAAETGENTQPENAAGQIQDAGADQSNDSKAAEQGEQQENDMASDEQNEPQQLEPVTENQDTTEAAEKKVKGIETFDEAGTEKSTEVPSELKQTRKKSSSPIIYIVVGIVLVAMAGGAVACIFIKRKKGDPQ